MNKTATQYGCFIDEPGMFDAPFFNMSPRVSGSGSFPLLEYVSHVRPMLTNITLALLGGTGHRSTNATVTCDRI